MAPEWSVLDRVVEYDAGWFTAGYDLVERPDGERARYYWVEPPDAVSVVAVTDDREVVLVEQYRPRQRETFVSCIAGAVEDDESFAEAGARELREETGYRAGRVETLQTYYGAGWLRTERGIVLARDLTPGDPDREDGEFLRTRTVPVAAALDRARAAPANGWTLLPLALAALEGHLDAPA